MPWNSVWPVGGVSVKANRTVGNQNTTYIETTMGNSVVGTNTNTMRDHFWDVGSNEDGRHRMIQSPAFTVGGNPDDPVLGVGMDSVLYAKTVLGSVQWFRRNVDNIYQATPITKTGTVNITSSSSYVTVTAIPANAYGTAYFFYEADPSKSASGLFSSSGTQTRGFTTRVRADVSGLDEYAVEMRNDDTGTLDLQVRRGDSSSALNGNWNYILTYRAF